MSIRIPAEVFPPGEYLKDELDARNWTQVEFAEIIGKDTRLVHEIVKGKRAITPETAMILAEAFGTSPELWMNLESQYQLSKVHPQQNSISRKAQLYTKFPVREMIKRGWIGSTKNVDVLEKQLLDFFEIKDIEEDPEFSHAARKQSYTDDSIKQTAWLYRAKKVALSAPAQKYSTSNLLNAIEELKAQLEYVDGIRNVASILAKAGVRFAIIEPLPGSKIDGACFWLNKNSPVVVLSLKHDRIDNFWHNLMHELDHVRNNEGMQQPIIDMEAEESDKMPANEKRANEIAADILIPSNEMTGFIARVNPIFTDEKIVGFAKRIKIHPGIVVGQLQHRNLIHWSIGRKHLAKIREFVTVSTLTDGYGQLVGNYEND